MEDRKTGIHRVPGTLGVRHDMVTAIAETYDTYAVSGMTDPIAYVEGDEGSELGS
jgi:hypothetical protein